jgi:hypothetical protein
VSLYNLKRFPAGSILDIKSVFINLTALSPEGLTVEVENARLKLPVSDSIFFYGKMKDGALNFNVYSNTVDVQEIIKLFPENQTLKHLRGFATNVDFNVTGNYRKPLLTGKLRVDKVTFKMFTVANASGRFNLNIWREANKIQLSGPVFIENGEVLAKRIRAELEASKVVFTGRPKYPELFLKGYSMVKDTKINIRITGRRDHPQMELSSYPDLPETKLLLMLVTGQNWGGLDESLSQGKLSPDLAKDALGYLFFGGSGNGVAQRLGVKDISISYDQSKKGIAFKEDLTKKLEVGYGVAQEPGDLQQQSIVTQTVEGELKMTDKLSVDVEHELKKHYDAGLAPQGGPISAESDDKLMLKYKRKF